MAKLLKLRRGTTTQHGSFTGAEGEVTVDTDKETLVVHDGSTAGGHPVAAEDMANVSSSAIAGRLSNDSIAVSKIAAGTLPSDVKIADANVSGNLTIESADIVDGTIATGDIANNAVTYAKMGDISQNRLMGRISSGGGDPETLTAANVRTIINVEDGATADQTAAEIRTLVESASDSNVFTDADHSKLNGIEASATADQSNAEIRAAVEAASDSNVFTDADHSKLNGIEASATADQTNAEIRAAVEAASDSNVFTDADHTKLNGIETSATADQTASEIVSLVNGQTITPAHIHAGTGRIGNDSNDYIAFSNNAHMDVVVNGSTEFRFEADGDFHADGDVIAQSTTISSDIRLKENIQVVPDALDKVESLRGVTFDWKRDGTPSAGVIAQEVQGVLPEAVKEVTPVKGGDSHLSVNYHALTSILIEAIKELKAEVEQLKGGE